MLERNLGRYLLSPSRLSADKGPPWNAWLGSKTISSPVRTDGSADRNGGSPLLQHRFSRLVTRSNSICLRGPRSLVTNSDVRKMSTVGYHLPCQASHQPPRKTRELEYRYHDKISRCSLVVSPLTKSYTAEGR